MSSLIVEKYLLIASTSIAESTPILHPSNFFPVCLVQFFSQYIMKSLYLILYIWAQIIINITFERKNTCLKLKIGTFKLKLFFV